MNIITKTEDILLSEFDNIKKDEYNLSLLLAGVGLCSTCAGSDHFGLTKTFKNMSCLGCSGIVGKVIIDMYLRKRELEKRKRYLSESYDELSKAVAAEKDRKIKEKHKKGKKILEKTKIFEGAVPKFVSHRGTGSFYVD